MAALKINDEPQASREPENVPAEDDTPLPDELGVLITGCQSTETSADVRPGNDPNRACGALSNAIQTVVKSHAETNPDEPIGTRKLVLEARALLKKKGFTQNPCLECMEGNADKSFLLQE